MKSDSDFFLLVARLYYERNEDVWNQRKLSVQEIRQIFPQNSKIFLQLERWTDLGLLHTIGGDYELLVPAFYDVVKKFLDEKPDKMITVSLQGLLYGWKGQPTPGHLIEKIVRDQIATQRGIEHFPEKIKVDNLLDHLNELITLTIDNGLDGLIVNLLETNVLTVETFQVKLGRLDL